MAAPEITIRRLDASDAEALTPQLIALLRDAVDGGASLGFWRPLADDRASAFWRGVIADVRANTQWLLVAQGDDGVVVGSVQLAISWKQNSVRRAEVQKLLVHSAVRRQGIGRLLMGALERMAKAEGRTLLFLDTLTGSDAEYLYQSLGYQRVGIIPRYVVESDGTEGATTIYYKSLIPVAAQS